MILDRPALRRKINERYRREHEELGEEGTRRMLEEAAETWDFSGELAAGGVITFAHVGVADCGRHVAAAVNACIDSGAETVLAISVLHAFTDEMEQARQDVAAGGSPSDHETWGIQGPGLDFREEWQGDHAMRSLRHFWEAATRDLGMNGRRLVERYPYLAGGRPGDLPNLEETARIAENAVIVATGDQFHHGIGYGTPPDEALAPDTDGLDMAAKAMENGTSL
ncbi:MAG: hypothetical protein KY394_06575, partial [Actinobacteria bacterium]|nr:hypothetical protein [Actinomycetota bacterium]